MTKKVAKKSTKKKVGRPTKYDEKFHPKSILEYFEQYEPYEINKDGEKVANDLPSFGMWCAKVGITRETMVQWVKEADKKPFSDAYKKCKEIQAHTLMTNGLHGLYHGSFAIFTAKNVIGWRDQVDVQQKSEISINIDNDDSEL